MTSVPEQTFAQLGSTGLLERLLQLVQKKTPKEGRNYTDQPGLFFYKSSQSLIVQKNCIFEPLLFVIVQGKKIVRFPGGELQYDPLHYLVLTGEARFESFLEASPERPYLSLCLQIPPELIAKTLLSLAEIKATPQEEKLPAFVSSVDASILEVLARFLQANEDPIERKVLCPLILEELVFRLLRSDAASVIRSSVTKDNDSLRIQDAMRFIQKNYAQDLSVQRLARQVAMSPSHFAHRFRAVARVSPIRYLKQIRLQEARVLLLAGTRTQEAASLVGYESPSHFTREFKAFFGDSPASYVRRLQAASAPK